MIHNDDDLRQFEANGALQLPFADDEGRVEHEGVRIWYAAYGAGEPVVLLHGAFDNSEDCAARSATYGDVSRSHR